MFCLQILPYPNIPASRLASEKPVSRKCVFSCASFLLGRSLSLYPLPQTLPLDLSGNNPHWAFLVQNQSVYMGWINWTEQQEELFAFSSRRYSIRELVGSFCTENFEGSCLFHSSPPFISFKWWWGTGISRLTSKGRIIWTRHCHNLEQQAVRYIQNIKHQVYWRLGENPKPS